MKYTKNPEPVEQLCSVLIQRNLLIADEDRAIKYLSTIGYFRLSGYMFHLQITDGTHRFFTGTSFEVIILHYNFDKRLRSIVSNYLERIEICLRAKLTDKYSLSHGFFWYNRADLFENYDIFIKINEEIQENFLAPKELFLKNYKNKYTSENLPPSTMALETLSLGKLARLYKALKNVDGKSEIALEFGLPSTVLSSWLIYLTNVRNICAHHSRLWNKKVTVDRPVFPSRERYKFKGENFEDSNTTLYGIISIIDKLLFSFNPNNSFTEKIEEIIEEFKIDVSFMGFPINWKQTANWYSK